jgi:imidazolonepropionase-like amidohydrolase
MTISKSIVYLSLCLFNLAVASTHAKTIVIKTGAALDGRGGVLQNAYVVIDGSVIKEVTTQKRGPVDYDLTTRTVMPGWIDTHVHMNWYIDEKGKAQQAGGNSSADGIYSAGHAFADLEAGFTTVQSIGSPADKVLRELLARGVVPGPRLLTSLQPLTDKSGGPEELRKLVRERVAQGADVIKLFATKSSRDGGGQTMSDAQLQAACGEANKLKMRSMVHAHASGGAKAAILAGCSTIEHGSMLDDETLDLMAQRNVYFDPNVSTTHHYLAFKSAFLGKGNYTEEGFAYMIKTIPLRNDVIRRAMAKHIKLVFGTDAVAGAHGRNAEEFIYRVHDAGVPASEAIISATSRAAESLRMGDKIGSLQPGLQADIVATDGNPLKDITAVRKVVFVMKSGKVYKNETLSSRAQ